MSKDFTDSNNDLIFPGIKNFNELNNFINKNLRHTN